MTPDEIVIAWIAGSAIAVMVYMWLAYWVWDMYSAMHLETERNKARGLLIGIFWPLAILLGVVYVVKNLVKLIKVAFSKEE